MKFKVGDKVKINPIDLLEVTKVYSRAGITKDTVFTVVKIWRGLDENGDIVVLAFGDKAIRTFEKNLNLLNNWQGHPLTKIFV